ncbi:hypothetical protein FHS79_002951 [Polymorphobacter multimanifer]|uniref:Uncharacterized protein n=1 Tax=Polymorphobacter multimanifer TaxID=1070431 RepID=A0A841L8K1_9SPHN|nr:hypothetical protein [Polymorphobacter multimanifer]
MGLGERLGGGDGDRAEVSLRRLGPQAPDPIIGVLQSLACQIFAEADEWGLATVLAVKLVFAIGCWI